MTALLAQRLALTGADDACHARLRAALGLAPSQASAGPRPGLAYCGREFRVYPSMRIGDAIRLYGALHERWNAERLAADMRVAGLGDGFEVKRMKRAYQRALVLALALAAEPHVLVVEAGDEFDEPPARALLERGIAAVPRALVTFAADAVAPGAFTAVLPADGFDAGEYARA